MRSVIVLAALVLVSGFVLAMSPFTAARPPLACAQGVGAAPCPGAYCVDSNLDGRFSSDECQQIYCVTGCCYECPPPYQ